MRPKIDRMDQMTRRWAVPLLLLSCGIHCPFIHWGTCMHLTKHLPPHPTASLSLICSLPLGSPLCARPRPPRCPAAAQSRMLPAFNTGLGIPLSDSNPRTKAAKRPQWSPYSSMAEATTLRMEYAALSQATGAPVGLCVRAPFWQSTCAVNVGSAIVQRGVTAAAAVAAAAGLRLWVRALCAASGL